MPRGLALSMRIIKIFTFENCASNILLFSYNSLILNQMMRWILANKITQIHVRLHSWYVTYLHLEGDIWTIFAFSKFNMLALAALNDI